ncbi:hypothetical protein CVIRNUC_007167 [Coccomyxa viridis]|uniref:Uncharacterized protein n=1 Tax=Coccomyxa viridis TaxID=1274662 RepID=A0AAV1ID95_9CHLO|nr:hypothetical protein CVIRNUC_007167 [Coccomyxa viridis]
MTLLPDANVTSIQVKRDNGGHILIKTSYAAATPSFQYTMKVHIFFLQELQACKLDPYRYIWQSIRDQLPDKAAHPEVLQALVMRRRIRQAAEAAIRPACLPETKLPRDCHALQLASSTKYLIEEADRLLMNVFSGITDAAEEQVMSEQLRHEGVSGQVQAIAGMHLSGVDSWPIPAETPAGPARAEEFLLVELERALMRVYASTHDSRLLDRLQLLLAHHEARGYLDTLPVADRAGREEFTLSMKELKRHVRKPATICHTPKARCYLLVDSYGALVAGLAMGWAILSLYIAWRLMGGSTSAGISLNFAGPVIVVLGIDLLSCPADDCVAYMLKDRMKVWGKRYFRCIADWTGVFLPECNSWLCTSEGVKVGTCGVASQVIRPEALRPEVRAARAAPPDGPAELVMCYSKCCKLNMSKIKP